MEETTTIRVRQITKERLYNLGTLDDTVDKVLTKIIDFYIEHKEDE